MIIGPSRCAGHGGKGATHRELRRLITLARMELALPHGRALTLDRPRIMGILNVTPDSFSDGGLYERQEAAVAHGLSMAAEGGDIIDVGGESTRPGAQPVGADEQTHRILGVIRRLHRELDRIGTDVVISVDTTLAEVARAALDAGAAMLNDVSAGRDPRNVAEGADAMFTLAAERGVPIVLMHMQNTPATMQQHPRYDDVVAEVEAFLLERGEAAMAAGVRRDQVVIDPGIGFGKTQQHNCELLVQLGRFVATGYPVLLGASRKRFMRAVCAVGGDRRDEAALASLLGGTCATTAQGVAAGVAIFRVHDVRANRAAADLAWAVKQHPRR